MKIVPEVTCRRCGATFSSLRPTCPHCGTSRTAQSTRTPNTTPSNNKGTKARAHAENNMKWQMIFGLILVVAVILAVIVMVSTGLNGTDGSKNHVAATPSPASAQQTEAPPEVEAAPTPSPTPTPQIQSVIIRYVTTDYTGKDFTMRLANEEELTLNAQVWPADLVNISEVKWSSSEPEILKVTDNGDGTCLVKIIGTKDSGYVTITAECFGVKAEVMVYCKN